MAKDFRYTMPDGSVVEGFQVHEGTRYQEDEWPDWMNSRYLMTKESEGKTTHWLNISDVETEIPEFGWIIKPQGGNITAVGYDVMENATKVVRNVPKVPDVAEPQSEQALRLAAKITKRSFEEVVADDLSQVNQANRNRQKIIDSMHPDDAAAQGFRQTGSPEVALVEVPVMSQLETDRGLLFEVRKAYQLLLEQNDVEAMEKLHDAIVERCNWCDCAPGKCSGTADMWDCRRNSPLAK